MYRSKLAVDNKGGGRVGVVCCPNGISPKGNLSCFPPGKASSDRAVLRNLMRMPGVLVFP